MRKPITAPKKRAQRIISRIRKSKRFATPEKKIDVLESHFAKNLPREVKGRLAVERERLKKGIDAGSPREKVLVGMHEALETIPRLGLNPRETEKLVKIAKKHGLEAISNSYIKKNAERHLAGLLGKVKETVEKNSIASPKTRMHVHELEAEYCMAFGSRFKNAGILANAINFFYMAKDLASMRGNNLPKKQIYYLTRIAECHQKRGHHELARNAMDEARMIAERLSDRTARKIARLRENLDGI